MNPDFERRGSKNSISPSSTIFGFFGLCASMGWMGSSADIAGGAAIIPIDSSDAINVRNIMVVSLKTRLWWRSRLRLQIIPYLYQASCPTLFCGRMYIKKLQKISVQANRNQESPHFQDLIHAG